MTIKWTTKQRLLLGSRFLKKHVPITTNPHATVEELLEQCFICGQCRDVNNQDSLEQQFSCGALASEQWSEHRSWRMSIVKIRYQETTSGSRLRRIFIECILLRDWTNRLIICRLTQHREMYNLSICFIRNHNMFRPFYFWSSSGDINVYNKDPVELYISLIWTHIYNGCCSITILRTDKINL
jgi:hypothetical protein